MRILQVIESFGGGSMQIALTIAERLAAAGHEVAVAHGAVAESPRNPRAAVPVEVELFGLRWGRRAQDQVRVVGELRATVRDWVPDIVHLHSSFAGFAGAVGLRGMVPLVYTPHGYSFIRAGQSRSLELALRLAEAAVARRVDLVGVVSEDERGRALEIHAPRVQVVPNGIPELDDPPGAPPHRPGRPRIVSLGRLDPARRPAAAARILASLSDLAEVTWIGGGEDPLADAVRRTGVPVTGWLERTDALGHLAQATACLHWSAWDAQPLSVLEAMARDVVVVASDIGANRELLGPRQVCASEQQARDLLRAIVLDRRLREDLLAEQQRRREGYGAARMAGHWERIYEETVASSRVARPARRTPRSDVSVIAHVSASMGFGGAERMLSDLAVEQARTGARVAIIAPAGALDRDWAAAGVQRIHIPPASRNPAEVARMTWSVAAALRRAAPDVVHAHNVKATAVVLAARAVGRDVPVLATMHGVAEADGARAARILRRADLTAAVSDAVRDEMVARGLPAEQVCVVRNGIGLAEPLDETRRSRYAAELSLGPRVVSAVGRLVPQKAHERVLDAAALVRRAHPDVTFLIVGEGPRRAELEARAAALGLQDVVRFTGARGDARALIALSDLLVFSSEWEGLSIAALEALAAGTPVVTTDVAGMRELLAGGAGSIVSGTDPADLAAAISTLLGDARRLQEMADRGRTKVEEEFSSKAMRERYGEAYRRLLRREAG